mmetsp:Transcript_31698/g.53626  ORF Transcript_31698/g.53626 Transcript_31698/m.53626 type:complete len:227 (+) Transcript_31698:2-682(+)
MDDDDDDDDTAAPIIVFPPLLLLLLLFPPPKKPMSNGSLPPPPPPPPATSAETTSPPGVGLVAYSLASRSEKVPTSPESSSAAVRPEASTSDPAEALSDSCASLSLPTLESMVCVISKRFATSALERHDSISSGVTIGKRVVAVMFAPIALPRDEYNRIAARSNIADLPNLIASLTAGMISSFTVTLSNNSNRFPMAFSAPARTSAGPGPLASLWIFGNMSVLSAE